MLEDTWPFVLHTMNKRLEKEAVILLRDSKLSRPRIRSLIELLDEYESRPLPDSLPLKPEWQQFQWPASEVVDFRSSPHQIKWSN